MKKFLLIFSITATVLYSQENNITLSGELLYDSQIVSSIIQIENKIEQQSGVDNRKSPLLAAALSFAVPGAGEFYSEQYLKSAIFIAAEIAAIAVGLIYDKKGDDQTESFQNYAHTHWDVKRYARWTIKNAASINPLVNSAEYSVFDNNGNVVWSELNRLESAIGKYYSHRLAPYRDQQYYEMIGKYPQFNVG